MRLPSKASIKTFIRRLFAWDTGTIIFATAFLLTFMTFNVLWCSWTTFTPFSHPPLYVSSGLMVLLFTLPYVIWRSRALELIILVLLDFLLVANLMYARTYFNAIPLSSYTNAGNLADFMPSVWASLRLADILFPLITLGAILALRRLRPRLALPAPTRRGPFLILLAIPLLVTICAFPTPGHFKRTFATYRNNAYAYQSTPVMYTVFGPLAYDALVATERLTPAQQRETLAFIRSLAPVPALPEGVRAPRNLVFILCESLESWAVGMDYYGQPVTPRLSALLADSTTFYDPHVLSQAKDGRSIDGQLLCLTGLLPLGSGTYATQYPDNHYPSLHKALRADRGSRCVLLTGDKEYAWNQGHIARNMGMDTIVSYPCFRLEDCFTGRSHIGDRALMRQCAEKLAGPDLWPVGTPAFIQMVTYSGHGPFRLPDNEKKIKIHPGTPQIMADYINTARYTDRALGIIIDYLRSRPDWPETMVVITGDHEGLATWRQECLDSPDGRRYVSPGQYVPLIILHSPIPGRSDKVMGQVDIYTTILHLMGLRSYAWPGLGRSILDPAHPGAALSPQGRLEGTTVPDTTAARLRRAATVSDRILRYDLLRPSR